MRLFVKIAGISPFVLELHDGLSLQNYHDIANKYFTEWYNGKPPGSIHLKRAVDLGQDKLLEYKLKETWSANFIMEVQEKLNIYQEPRPCEESIVMIKSPAPEFTDQMVPKVISLNRLILKITDPYSDEYLAQVFWQTYRSFTKPIVVLRKLIERFDVPQLLHENYNYSGLEEAHYYSSAKRLVKERVIRMLDFWVKNYFFDFDNEMKDTLQKFCEGPLQQFAFGVFSKKLLASLKTIRKEKPWDIAKKRLDEINAKILSPEIPPISLQPEETVFDVYTTKEIANQLTLLDYTYYNEISFMELQGQSWNKEAKRYMSPSVISQIGLFNKVSNWVSYKLIFGPEDDKKRAKSMQKLIAVMVALKEMNSFNMIQAIDSGLKTSAVHRLSDTWALLEEEDLKKHESIEELLKVSQNSKAFRETMTDCYKNGYNCAPYIGIYLKDIVFCEDGNPTYIEGKVNFLKCINKYNITFQILRFQKHPYKMLQPIPQLQKEILSFYVPQDSSLEDAMYQKSLSIQPRR